MRKSHHFFLFLWSSWAAEIVSHNSHRIIKPKKEKLRGLGRKNEGPAMNFISRVQQTASQACFTRWIALNVIKNEPSSGSAGYRLLHPFSEKSEVKK